MKNYFMDKNGKHVTIHDHVHHISRTDNTSIYQDRRGIVVEIHPLDNEATIWFYDTRASEFIKWHELSRPIY